MKATRILAAALACFFVAVSAEGSVTEPNGKAVPVASGEVQLYTLFQQRSESIDWQADAHDTPNSFSPICGFTATYVMNQAGAHYGLSWYNDTGTTPTAGDLHPLVPPNSAVGTTFSGTVIKNDPAYTGGLVGFALVGGETHYTNASYDTVCSACNPAGPWITALMYASTVTSNAYYVCFEDGSTTFATWSNDGDFNDDVYFITGITCSGGGQPCDTGKPGICAAGLTQCGAGATTCKQLNTAGTTETCNGLDDDCNGQVDDGAACPNAGVCNKGTCVASCSHGEFQCPADEVCSTDGVCVDSRCANVTCPTGQICTAGNCAGPCDGVTCPHPQVCRVGVCVDPCAGVTCDTGQVCEGGVCVASCSCLACASGKACDAVSGHCVETACASVKCGAGTYCVAGSCVDDCTGATCPAGEACSGGACVAAPDAGTSAGDDDAGGLAGPTVDGGATAGDASNGATPGSTFGTGVKASCGCRLVGGGGARGGAAQAAVGLGLAFAARRRRRRESRASRRE